MWLVGQSPKVREAVGGYFRDPGNYEKLQGGSGILPGSGSVLPNPVNTPVAPTRLLQNKGEGPSDQEKQELSIAAQNLLQELKKQPAFERLRKNIRLQMTSEGLRIILNESAESPAFFEPGSAKLLQKSAVILMTIARQLGQLNNRLVIEGYTTSTPTESRDYTNWDLSADRANAARELMDVSGLRQDQVREVRGFADRFPMIEDNPADPRNRRVSIVVLYQSRERFYDQIAVGDDLMADAGSEVTGDEPTTE